MAYVAIANVGLFEENNETISFSDYTYDLDSTLESLVTLSYEAKLVDNSVLPTFIVFD